MFSEPSARPLADCIAAVARKEPPIEPMMVRAPVAEESPGAGDCDEFGPAVLQSENSG